MMTMSYSETLVVTSCWCGVNLAIPENLHRWALQSDARSIYCPLGHEFTFSETFEKKLKREQEAHDRTRQRERATRDLLRQEERSHRTTRGHLTRARTRAKAGVCPCCHRTFQNVARHVATKHPDFEPSATS